MIRFLCASCQVKLSVKDELAGKKVRCPGCQTIVAVPPLGAASADGLAKPSSASFAEARPLPPRAPTEAEEPARPPNSEGQPAQGGGAGGQTERGPGGTIEATRSLPGTEPIREQWDFLAPPQRDDEMGRLGPYRVLKVLGAGGMGVVFQAEDPKLKRKVALKAMLPALGASETARKRFLREAQTAAAIEHDNIVPIYHVGEDRGVPFIAMPLLKGEPLNQKLKRGEPVPVAEVLRIGREIALGLCAAHEAGLVHRDIKPANIWLEGEPGAPPGEPGALATGGRVKILDFGLARAAADDGQLTHQGSIVGTPAYMAPEQGARQPVDGRCDLFSLGCVLYYLCTGQPPFKGADTLSTLLAVATHNPPAPAELRPELPGALSDLVMELLAKKPEDRPESARAVAAALQEIEGQADRGRAQRGRPAKTGEPRRQEGSAPPRPRGSRIKEHRTSGGCRLQWPLPGSGPRDYLPHLFSLCLVGYSVYNSLSLLWLYPRVLSSSTLILSVGWPILALVPMLRFFKPSRPEIITLGTTTFRHDLGRPGGFLANVDNARNQGIDSRPWWRQLLGLPLVVEMSRDELGQVVIERVGGQLRLRYDYGADRLEIGRYLREPEKEWLAEVIRAWQESG